MDADHSGAQPEGCSLQHRHAIGAHMLNATEASAVATEDAEVQRNRLLSVRGGPHSGRPQSAVEDCRAGQSRLSRPGHAIVHEDAQVSAAGTTPLLSTPLRQEWRVRSGVWRDDNRRAHASQGRSRARCQSPQTDRPEMENVLPGSLVVEVHDIAAVPGAIAT